MVGLSPLNGTFERKTLVLPFPPDTLLLGRQHTLRLVPAPDNGYFDSRVLSRTHAEIWADYETGKVYIKDLQSSNGTFVNSLRLDPEVERRELRKDDVIELGTDIPNEEVKGTTHRRISAKVDQISILPLQQRRANAAYDSLDLALFGDLDTSLNELSALHNRNTANSHFLNSTSSTMMIEAIVKKLVHEINQSRIDLVKAASVAKLLKQIHANQILTSSVLRDTRQASRQRIKDYETTIADLTKSLDVFASQSRDAPKDTDQPALSTDKPQLQVHRRPIARHSPEPSSSSISSSSAHSSSSSGPQLPSAPAASTVTNDGLVHDSTLAELDTARMELDALKNKLNSFYTLFFIISPAFGVLAFGVCLMTALNNL